MYYLELLSSPQAPMHKSPGPCSRHLAIGSYVWKLGERPHFGTDEEKSFCWDGLICFTELNFSITQLQRTYQLGLLVYVDQRNIFLCSLQRSFPLPPRQVGLHLSMLLSETECKFLTYPDCLHKAENPLKTCLCLTKLISSNTIGRKSFPLTHFN